MTCFCCHQYGWEMCRRLLKNIQLFHPDIQASSYIHNVIILHILLKHCDTCDTYIWTYLWLSYSGQTKQMSSSPRPLVSWEMNVCPSSFQSAVNTRKQQFSHLFNKSTEGFTTLLLLLTKPSFCLPNSHNPAFIGCRTTRRWDCLSQVFADDVLWFPPQWICRCFALWCVKCCTAWQAQTRGRLTVREQVGLSERGTERKKLLSAAHCEVKWAQRFCCVYKVSGGCVCLYMANDYRNDFLLTE